MIQVTNLSYRYDRGPDILKELNFTIKAGEFVAIIGQNGAGKTTLLKQFNGLLQPTQGQVLINGLNTAGAKTSRLAKHIGFLFQNPDHQIFCQTVQAEIAFGLTNAGVRGEEVTRQVKKAADLVGIADYLECNPFTFSKGQRQRVALASVLAVNTEILILDEPTTGLGYQEGLQIMELIQSLNKSGKTIVFVTHDMDLVAAYARRVIILANGEILEDGPTETTLTRTASLAAAKLQPPQICRLAEMFHREGLFHQTYTVEDMAEAIIALSGGERIVSHD